MNKFTSSRQSVRRALSLLGMATAVLVFAASALPSRAHATTTIDVLSSLVYYLNPALTPECVSDVDPDLGVTQQDCHYLNQTYEQWKPVKVTGTSYWKLMPQNRPTYCLADPGYAINANVQLKVEHCTSNATNEEWSITSAGISPNFFYITQNHFSGKCMDTKNASTAEGALIVQNFCSSSAYSQFWENVY